MVAKFLDDNNMEFLQRRRRTAKKKTGLDWQKINFARASRFSVDFLAVVARLRHETSYLTRPLYGVGDHEHNTKSFFFFF